MAKIDVAQMGTELQKVKTWITENKTAFENAQTKVEKFNTDTLETFQGETADSIRAYTADVYKPIHMEFLKIETEFQPIIDSITNDAQGRFGANGIVDAEFIGDWMGHFDQYVRRQIEVADHANAILRSIASEVSVELIDTNELEEIHYNTKRHCQKTIEQLNEFDDETASKMQGIQESILRLQNMVQEVSTKAPVMSGYKAGSFKFSQLTYDESGKPVYDENGEYGGSQSDPVHILLKGGKSAEDLKEIIRKYYPNFSDLDILNYLKKLRDEGCGYVAMINTVFDRFTNEEFEKKFGFPKYDTDGNLNFNLLVVDFYAATDNHNSESYRIFWSRDEINEDEDTSNIDGKGTSNKDREYRFEMYMQNHGVTVDVKNDEGWFGLDDIEVTPEKYIEYNKQGKDLVISIHPVKLLDANGEVAYLDEDGGHAMTVTGIDDKGNLIVSSWGKKYFINPKDPEYTDIYMQAVSYE